MATPRNNGKSRVMGGPPMPRISPFSEMGVASTPIFGGFIQTIERNVNWAGQQKYVTTADIVTNVSIVAASVHYFLNLISRPKWTVVPPSDDDAEAKKLAEFMEAVLDNMETPWQSIVRRAGMYRFHGFSIQEWTAKKFKDTGDKLLDGKIGYKDIEQRSQYTIERWSVLDDGTVDGVLQRSPQTSKMLAIPIKKTWYLVEDTLSDSPEGLGVFRHMAEPWNRLKKFLELETIAFERDLRGTPIGRVPLTAIREAVKGGALTEAQGNTLIQSMQNFVTLQVKQQNTGMILDSIPYTSTSANGPQVSGVMQWGIELLQGSSNGLQELHNAIDRLQREMARIIGTESIMLGDGSGGANRALSEDKSKNLYLTANSVLTNMAAIATKDIVDPIWALNGFPDELKPELKPEDVAFKDVNEITNALQKMATAGAVLDPMDPAIDDVRDLLGIQRPDKEAQQAQQDALNQQDEQAQGMVPGGGPGADSDLNTESPDDGIDLEDDVEDDPRQNVKKLYPDFFKQAMMAGTAFFKAWDEGKHPRHPRGSSRGGMWRPVSDTPSYYDAVDMGLIDPATTSQEQWQQLSPGMRREIARGSSGTQKGFDPWDTFDKFEKYNPNQRRVSSGFREGGRFTSTGAGTRSGEDPRRAGLHRPGAVEESEQLEQDQAARSRLKPKPSDKKPSPKDMEGIISAKIEASMADEFVSTLPPEVQQKIAWAEQELEDYGPSTIQQYMQDGQWSPERQALHGQILDRFFNEEAVRNATPKDGEQPDFVMLGGRPGAGKTTALKSGVFPIDPKNYVTINADEFQESLPGYKPHLAGKYTQEGQYLAETAERIARDLGINVIYDATMKSTQPAIDRMKALRAAGYKTSVFFVHVKPQTSARRALASRFMNPKDGRYVPARVLVNALTNEQTFGSVQPMADRWALFDGNDSKPRLVAAGGR